jgi:hypothetical protein
MPRLAVLVTLLLVGCATTAPPPKPTGLAPRPDLQCTPQRAEDEAACAALGHYYGPPLWAGGAGIQGGGNGVVDNSLPCSCHAPEEPPPQ